jgi:predicted Zn-dependent protease
MRTNLLALAALLLCGAASAHPLKEDSSLAAEIARATTSLHMEDYASPYYVALRLADVFRSQLVYDFGHPAVDYSMRDSELTVEVRVGSSTMDNHPMGARTDNNTVNLAYDGAPFATAHEAWRTIDESYKKATADFLNRQAQRVERGRAEYETDDLAPEPRHQYDEAPVPEWHPSESFRAGMREVSQVLRGFPEFLGSGTSFDWASSHKHILNSEGTRVAATNAGGWLEITADAMSTDGIRLTGRRTWFARHPDSLPPWDQIRKDTEDMAKRLRERAASAPMAPFNAPAILDPSISATAFLALDSRLEGEEQRNPEGGQTFRKELGSPILPSFLTIADDPTVASYDGKALAGNYKYDEEGVPAQRVSLIESGVLKNFLLSRYPIPDLPKQSNGHGRAASGRLPMARPGNIFVSSSKTQDVDKLKAALMEECRKRGKPYGIWIRRALSWSQQSTTGEHQSFRAVPEEVVLVDANTGKETLTHGLDLVGTPRGLLSRVMATGTDAQAINFFDDQQSGTVSVGVVSPSLLVAEVELQRSEGKPTRKPVLPPPSPSTEAN